MARGVGVGLQLELPGREINVATKKKRSKSNDRPYAESAQYANRAQLESAFANATFEAVMRYDHCGALFAVFKDGSRFELGWFGAVNGYAQCEALVTVLNTKARKKRKATR